MNINPSIPAIVKETSSGYIRYNIQDEMLKHREVDCTGEITTELVNGLILQLRYLQRKDPNKEITMYINSNGGSVTSGLALYDVMQGISCPIRTVCVGIAASMGALLFASGDKRDILPHSKVMIHDPLISGGLSGSALDIEERSKDLMKTREITGKIIAKHTGKKLSEVYKKTSKDSFFSATEAIEYGLADKILEKI